MGYYNSAKGHFGNAKGCNAARPHDKREDFKMKKYKLGALNVSDKGLQDTKEEIVIELIDRMQKYVADGKAAFENGSFTTEQKLNQVKYCCGRFCGLSDFLVGTMGIDVRREDGFMYTQEMYNHFHYWQMMLEIEIKREREAAGLSEAGEE